MYRKIKTTIRLTGSGHILLLLAINLLSAGPSKFHYLESVQKYVANF